MVKQKGIEPNFEMACGWWPEMEDCVTPIGWKDHMFRYNVMYNGTIIARPDPRLIYSEWERFKQWKDLGVQLSFPYLEAYEWWEHYGRGDDGMTRQGWDDEHPTPLLWSQWPRNGILIQQEVFGYTPGAKAVETGVEPLFAWVRLSVADRLSCLFPDVFPTGRFPLNIRINRPYIIPTMEKRLGLLHQFEKSKYSRQLKPSGKYGKYGFRLLEPDKKVRLGIAPGAECDIQFSTSKPNDNDSLIQVWIKPELGQKVDLLVPMLPCDQKTFRKVLGQGFDACLEQADGYWDEIDKMGATISVPEVAVNRAIKYCMKNTSIIAEKNPDDGHYALLTSSFGYPMVWTVQVAMEIACALDPLGYHEEAAKYLEVFRIYQGRSTPTSPFIKKHPGFLTAPTGRSSIPWLTDHGAVLYAVCYHIQLTDDKEFTERWLDAIIKACEFIYDSRRITGHGGTDGLIPPGSASDHDTAIQGIWTDGWYYKAYVEAIKILKKLNHPAAAKFEKDAREYKKVFVKAFTEQTQKMPEWRDRQGKVHHLTPMSLLVDSPVKKSKNVFSCDDKNQSGKTPPPSYEPRHPFYMDTGPLFLVFAGLFDASDPLMESTLLWFREGPQHRHFRRESSRWQVPVLDHEMSSCEPYFSWNIYHSHQLGDREKFLEGMYSQFAGAMSRQTFSCVESRHSQFGIGPQYQCFLMARLAAVDDVIVENELHLLRMTPSAWLSSKKWSVFRNVPTLFGPVSIRFKLKNKSRTLVVKFQHKFRETPEAVYLHIPPVDDLQRIEFICVEKSMMNVGRRRKIRLSGKLFNSGQI